MSPETFKAWRNARFRSQAAAGEALGKSRHSIMRYERDGVPADESRTLALAMRAIANDLPPWSAA
jgi:hypothetical protein